MAVTDDNIRVTLDGVKVLAYLGSAWVDLTDDVLQSAGLSYGGGIRGIKPVDFVASSGPARFVLKNETGKYYPDGTSALTGWQNGVPILIQLVYRGYAYTQYYGRAEIDFQLGQTLHPSESRVTVTVNDWFKMAGDQPIVTPSTQRDKRADQAATTI